MGSSGASGGGSQTSGIVDDVGVVVVVCATAAVPPTAKVTRIKRTPATATLAAVATATKVRFIDSN